MKPQHNFFHDPNENEQFNTGLAYMLRRLKDHDELREAIRTFRSDTGFQTWFYAATQQRLLDEWEALEKDMYRDTHYMIGRWDTFALFMKSLQYHLQEAYKAEADMEAFLAGVKSVYGMGIDGLINRWQPANVLACMRDAKDNRFFQDEIMECLTILFYLRHNHEKDK